MKALLNSGIERVVPDDDEKAHIRKLLLQSNRSMAEQGEYSLELYDDMMRYVQEYRIGSQDAAGN